MSHKASLERWIWIELIGFDNTATDFGVGRYCDTAGFVPDAICLLMSSPDIVFQHPGMDKEVSLPIDICSREGHSHNQDRERQTWTNYQVRGLVEALLAKGIKVFLSFFTQYFHDRHHQEWTSDYLELQAWHAHEPDAQDIDPLLRLKTGEYFEDIFTDRLVTTLSDYGFTGWHGPDGWGPLEGPLYEVDFADDMIGQFADKTGLELPEVVLRSCDGDMEKRQERATWIWQNMRYQWITFCTDRLTAFWRKVLDRLHAVGKLGVINNAWTRAPWESLYRYGVDYRKIVDAGVDAIVVETVAAGLCLDPHPNGHEANRSYDLYSMLMLTRAYVPQAKLVALLNTQDIVEQWDVIRHAPTVVEREIFNLTNVFHTNADGTQRRSVDGMMICLGDGLHREEWRLLNQWWNQSVDQKPRRSCGVTLVWSDQAMHNQIDDFTNHRTMDTHRVLSLLMEKGSPIQTTVRIEELDKMEGPILLINPHLFTETEKKQAMAYCKGSIIAIGPDLTGLGEPDRIIADVHLPRPFQCAFWGLDVAADLTFKPEEALSLPEDLREINDDINIWNHLVCRKVSDGFLEACTKVLMAASGGIVIDEPSKGTTSMVTELDSNLIRVALKNKMAWYLKPRVDLGKLIRKIHVKTEFPVIDIKPNGSSFQVRVPANGIVILDVELV